VTELLRVRLKAWRGKLSQKEAAAKLDVHYPTYRKYETGKRTPSKLAAAELDRRLVERKP
jgi:transcriptional regulator with XRE-family HTH domain